jgi:hypothetical protein
MARRRAGSVAEGVLHRQGMDPCLADKERRRPVGAFQGTRARRGALQRVEAVPQANLPGSSDGRRLLGDQR